MLPANSLASELDPLIVTAPTVRCGTTLLQRLICSSPDALLFGEPAAAELMTALRLIGAKVSMYSHNRAQFVASLESFTAGNVNDWMIDLMPDVDGYLHALVDGYLQPLAYCRDFARRAGRRVWGVKFPGWSAEELHMVVQALPRAKVIVIHRDIVPVLRSQKARSVVFRGNDVKALCAQWAANMQFVARVSGGQAILPVLGQTGSSVLHFAYEDLARDPEPILQRLEAFAGLAGIDRGVLAHRVNEWSGDERRPEYIPPAELTEAELALAEAARQSIGVTTPA